MSSNHREGEADKVGPISSSDKDLERGTELGKSSGGGATDPPGSSQDEDPRFPGLPSVPAIFDVRGSKRGFRKMEGSSRHIDLLLSLTLSRSSYSLSISCLYSPQSNGIRKRGTPCWPAKNIGTAIRWPGGFIGWRPRIVY